MKQVFFTLTAISILIFNLGCEDKKESNLFKAQYCIDKATASNVNDCLELLGSQNNRRANVLRCSAAFIAEGIDEDAIVDVIRVLDKDENSAGGSAPAISALTMSSTDAANGALAVCETTESDTLIALAGLASISTAMSSVLSLGANPTEAQVQAAIDGFSSGDATSVGNAVIANQDSMCNPDSGLFKDSDECTKMNAAIKAGGGNDAIGQAFINSLKN